MARAWPGPSCVVRWPRSTMRGGGEGGGGSITPRLHYSKPIVPPPPHTPYRTHRQPRPVGSRWSVQRPDYGAGGCRRYARPGSQKEGGGGGAGLYNRGGVTLGG